MWSLSCDQRAESKPKEMIPMKRKAGSLPARNSFSAKWPALFFLVFLFLVSSVLAVGQAESVIYRFQGYSDGCAPYGGLISDKAGNFYGTTSGSCVPESYGSVFELSPPPPIGGPWTETVLYSFSGGSFGEGPRAGLVFDQTGNLYGMTFAGTAGTVFQLSPPAKKGDPWTETAIYTFQGDTQPRGDLVLDKAGNLYGVTAVGGEKGDGAVFQLTPSQGGAWTETVIHSFTGRDGANPESGPIISPTGNLIGTLLNGGKNGFGAVYELKAPVTKGGAWTEHVLYSFKGGSDVSGSSRLVFDRQGHLDGVGGGGAFGQGAAFQLTRQGSSWAEVVIYSFCAQSNCADGNEPIGSLIVDKAGNIYGTTEFGGNGPTCRPFSSCGTVFQLKLQGGAWTETVLYSFKHGRDAHNPVAPLAFGKFGVLYGTTPFGGTLAGQCYLIGCGAVFKARP
jgi:uncharacterized repeat protein (TIGR03803 family)